jgi:RNA polymerase sigma-70 factor (TIGR02943 family)
MRRLLAEDGPVHNNLPEPGEWLSRYGDALYCYALSRLRHSHEAEEAVQETLLAALTRRGEFQGRSDPRTWLMGILKHKVLDRLRGSARAARETSLDDLGPWFDSNGKWRRRPRPWDDPAGCAERAEFWDVVRACLARLPERMAAAFLLRTLDDRAPADVCRELAISSANLWVLLHRARLHLVRCLDLHWFQAER